MVVAWIVAVWLLSLAVFVALRAHGTKEHRKGEGRRSRSASTVQLPKQRQPQDSSARVSDRG